MDSNKLTVLRELPYKVARVCGLCKYGVFPNNDWGTCAQRDYTHKKHTGGPRQLSIVRFGSCKQFESDLAKEANLGAYKEFLTNVK